MHLFKWNEFCKYSVQIAAVSIATLAMMSDGMQFAWSSPAVPKLIQPESPIPMSIEEAGWVTTTYILGNVLGVLISILMFNRMSRKLGILVAAMPILVAWLGSLLAPSLLILLISRFIGGIGRNMIFVVIPMYIGEIAHPNIRGALGTLVYTMMNLGVILVYAVTPFTKLLVSSALGLAIITMQIILLKFIPESPYYLLSKDNYEKAHVALETLRGNKNVDEEMKQLADAVKRQTAEKGSFIKLFTIKSNLKALGISLFLRAVQMMSGISVMTMHVHTIFAAANDNFSPEYSALIYAIMMFISCLCTMGVMDKYGRKSLMITSSLATAVVLLLQGTYFYLKTIGYLHSNGLSWIPILLMVLFVLNYRLGLGTVPMIMVAELFPANVKVSGVVLSHLMYSLSAFCSNVIFQYTEEEFGMYTPFWIFGILCVLSAIFSWHFVPETKGKTLEEIQFLLMNKTNEKTEGKIDVTSKV